jgi:DsbC/DsbD-like thiol-disulfide interchange protein
VGTVMGVFIVMVFLSANAGEKRKLPMIEQKQQTGDEKEFVRTSLLADVDSIGPGQKFYVGVYFQMDPDWYIYWKDPGDAGLPTTVEFQFPPGFTVAPLDYPVCEKFVEPGDIVCYGYKNSLLLIAAATAPDAFSEQNVRMTAKASWLSCSGRCVLGQSRLELTLPAGPHPGAAANETLFNDWLKRLPQSNPAADASHEKLH